MRKKYSPAHPHLRDPQAFALLHIILLPGLIAIAAYVSHASGFDVWLAQQFFDPASSRFPAHSWVDLELIGHHLAKSAVVLLWVGVLVLTCYASIRADLAEYRSALWACCIAMALAPTLVASLKEVNSYQCPWHLKLFGGYADYVGRWFVTASEVGRCFPGGHAAGGFSLLALYFLALEVGKRRVSQWLLIAALVTGGVFSFIRILQGAHFLSHNLWSAAICWCVSALIFLPLRWKREVLARKAAPL